MRRMVLLAAALIILTVGSYPAWRNRAVQAYNTTNLLRFEAVASPHLEPKV
ncbi:MAG TPA: hypothetical protein GXX50_04520 [Firmicutes bacterium]|uniref:hypothetical protein n=1 Tax=Gelria sp. Kuro-4 TaxID=2796927 RepID=UPI0019A57C86|nr:hypothetical protein [Gelria sp. Kuro-4]MDI3522715.1 hypothetical protein [Bacillota bacterium]BCV24711.1 hypothetical protein kuro4_14840 [Gelria sp. Kuro-4]HHV57012.1 hypothetical protein [Bacillota bacterium]